MSTVQFSNWSDFRRVGIDYLTGEACGLMLRGLCDLTARGKRLVSKTFGIEFQSEAWNSGGKADPHVASILLHVDMLPMLSIFACLETGGIVECYALYNKDKTWAGTHGFSAEDAAERDEWIKCVQGFGCSVRRYAYEGTAGDRNRHEMSGRIV